MNVIDVRRADPRLLDDVTHVVAELQRVVSLDPARVLLVGAGCRDIIHSSLGLSFRPTATSDTDLGIAIEEWSVAERIETAFTRIGSNGIRYRIDGFSVDIVPDRSIEKIASAGGITYTRWVDDLSFSRGGLDDSFLEALRQVVEADGWTLNDRKTRFMRRSPYVLGLYVGHDVDQPRLPRWVKRKILLESYYFAKYGASHFETPGVYPPRTLLVLCAYAFSVEPDLADKVYPRLAGLRRSNRRAREADDALSAYSYLDEAEFDRLIAELPDE